MSGFEIKKGEGFDEGVSRAFAGEVDSAQEALTTSAPSDEQIHDARKHIKRARALLRLTAGWLPAEERRDRNVLLRDAGRALSAARDRNVVRRLSGQLTRRGTIGPEVTLATARLERAEPETPLPVETIVDQLARAKNGVGIAEANPPRSRIRAKGLRRSYQQGLRAMRRARAEQETPAFHEWRKRAKDLRYQMEFLAPIWPGVLDAAAEELARLTDVLGDANDLGVLIRALVPALQEGAHGAGPGDAIATLLEKRAALWEEALGIGERFYVDSPRGFAEHMKAAWRSSR